MLWVGVRDTQAQTSALPSEYFANYHVSDQWRAMVGTFEQIQASVRVGTFPDPGKFTELSTIFSNIFQYFPQTPSRRVVYEQCMLAVEPLRSWFDQARYAVYQDRCFNPLNEIMRTIASQYTVNARITASPNRWSAPLNVTFDARESKDAPFSNDTLPDSNFFWYYRDVDGRQVPIGRWAVVNHTFERAGNYIVHLTARSANNLTRGIFDGEASVSVNVWPRSANLAVYIAGQEWTQDGIVRLGTHEAQRGVLIDGTGTTPLGGRTIVEYAWQIVDENDARFVIRRSGSGHPDQFVQEFPRNGLYRVTLQVRDNENNAISATYRVSVSDPVAIIRMSPAEWDTLATFTFDASGSYSLTSRVARYQWVITDNNGRQIDSFETRQFRRKFTIPGEYAVRLTVTDERGVSSFDVKQIYVESTPPVPAFTHRSMTDLLYPSQFILDAWGTFDEDVRNGVDSLTYEWVFSPRENVGDEQFLEDGKIAIVTFDEPGTYRVQLNVTDSYQKTSSLEREIEVVSTLRPEMRISPSSAVIWWEEIEVSLSANKQISYIERNFGDGNVQRTTSNTVRHRYRAAGMYPLRALAVTPSGEENVITRLVFVGQQDKPTAAYEIRVTNNQILLPSTTETCDGQPAFVVDRYERLNLDASMSRSVRWAQNDPLNIVLQQQNHNQQRNSRMQLEFDEMWCQFVDIFVEDPLVAQSDVSRVWFSVQNALPQMDNVTLSFPQYGDHTSIGHSPLSTPWGSSTQPQDIFSTQFLDPVTVRVHVSNPRDSDGFITKFIWYYIRSDDPDNLLEVKYTPPGVPYAIFSVPRQSWTDFEFGVRIVDSDGWETDSREYFGGRWPIVSFPPDNNNPDIPIASLRASATNIQVGDEVTFTTTASLLSRKEDFEATRYFKYDFTGDGIYDLTTNRATVTHTYTTPSPDGSAFRPRVKVYYRNRAGTAFSAPIIVRQRLQPELFYSTFDTKVLFVPTVFGQIENTELCLDVRKCTQDDAFFRDGLEPFVFDYEEPGSYQVRFFAMDSYGNQRTERKEIVVEKEEVETGSTQLGFLSYPAGRMVDDVYEIAVGNALRNTIHLYAVHSGAGNCFIDRNVLEDSSGDGDPLRDMDASCNELVTFQYVPNAPTVTARVYYARDGRPATQDIRIEFLDYEEIITLEHQQFYDDLDRLVRQAQWYPQDDLMEFYVTLLIDLRDGLDDIDVRTSAILQIYDLLMTTPNLVPEDHRTDIEFILLELSDGAISASLGWNQYQTAKMDVLLWFQGDAREEIQRKFVAFENFDGSGGPEARKAYLDDILNIAAGELERGAIDEVDFAVITRSLCEIIVFYDLPSVSCGTLIALPDDIPVVSVDEWRNVMWVVLRWVLWIVGILLVGFIALIFLFAIKAKMQKKQWDAEDDDATES